MSITPISPAVLRYVRAFRLILIVMIDGRVRLSTNPAADLAIAQAAWWAPRKTAGRAIKLATKGRIPIEEAAFQLGVKLAPHHHVVTRAGAAVERSTMGSRRR